ncbi:MAG: signal recognition particle protein [Spartobacteria bacterium]|nr:signal recognition particle protein [Spartobacteria bacterium]
MFDSLSQSLQKVFKNLRGYGKLSEKNVKDALREVRLALLEADVNFEVARDFIAKVRETCLGEEVLESVTPGQQVIKRVHDQMVELLGGAHKDFNLSDQPAQVMMLGLHGAGKTTTTGKLALYWKKAGRKVMLVACDIRRPAAVEQLRILAGQVDVPIVTPEPGERVPDLGRRAMRQAVKENIQVVIYDTGGRFQIDEELVQELKDLRDAVHPKNVVLVLDAAMGQESVHVAQSFNESLGLTGLILTKLDGDARGGAALSVQAVTGCPVILTGAGEKMSDLEAFHPERMASRILGMGDVVSLVEKAQEVVDAGEMARMEERLMKNTFNLEDFLAQLQQLKKMGPIENLLEMLPMDANVPAHVRQNMAALSGDEMKKAEAIIHSMTAKERQRPDIINGSRRKRVAAGSGTDIRDVNDILKRFNQAKKMAKQMKKAQKRLLRFAK